MTAVHRGVPHDTDVLIRQVDRHLARLRLRPQGRDLDLAERIAACLRNLIVDTAHASAADRARVRAAVRFFVAGRQSPGPSVRSLAADQRVVNDVARRLGRSDLVIAEAAASTDPSGELAGDQPIG
jgi:hypothetical protein